MISFPHHYCQLPDKTSSGILGIIEIFRIISKFVCIYSTISQGNFKCVPRILTFSRKPSSKNLKIRMSFCIPKYHQEDEDFLGLQPLFRERGRLSIFFHSVGAAQRTGLPFDHWSLFDKGTLDREGCVFCATF